MRKPTIKQITALKYINDGMSKRQAMLKAGYSLNSANAPSQSLMNKKGVETVLTRMQKRFKSAGLTEEFIAKKFQEWLSAQKTTTSPTGPDIKEPDYDIQLKAYDKWEKIVGLKDENTQGIKRKMTIEEFIVGTEKEDAKE